MTRRSPGDGTLFKDSRGYWVGGVEFPPGPNGKRRYKRVVRKDRNDAVKALRKLQADLAAGNIATTPDATVAKWLEYWLDNIMRTRVKPTTFKAYGTTARLYVIPQIGEKKVSKLTPADVRGMLTALQSSTTRRGNAGTRNAQKAHQLIHRALEDAVREGMVNRNVARIVDKPSHTKQKRGAFSLSVSTHIIKTAVEAGDDMWSCRWMLGFTTGERECEVLGLTWDRVDLELGEIDTSWQLQPHQKKHGCGQPQDGGWPCGFKRVSFCPQAHWDFPPGFEWEPCEGTLIFTRPKSAAGIRRIPLTPGMVAALKILKSKDGRNPHNLLFHHPDGKPVSQDQDQKAWKDLLVKAQIPHVSQHVMRDSCATLLMESGVDGHIVQSILGHSDVVTTHGYQHVNLSLARSALQNLDVLIPNNAGVDLGV
jgi:integrase